MISNILVGGALLLRLVAPVAAAPQLIGRDQYCTATVTVYSSIDGGSSPSAILAPTDGASAAPGPITVTELRTTTIISTIYASTSPGRQQTTDSPIPGRPQTVTVTATSILTLVETQTVLQTQIVTQDRTIVQTQTVTQTLAQAYSAQTDIEGPFYGDPDEPSFVYTTVTSTFTTILTSTAPLSGPRLLNEVPPHPTSPPHYSNGTQTGQYSNSSPSFASGRPSVSPFVQSISNLPPTSTTVSLASTPSQTPSPSSYSSSGYENGLYFVNWFVPWKATASGKQD